MFLPSVFPVPDVTLDEELLSTQVICSQTRALTGWTGMIDPASRVYQGVFGSTLTFGLELAPKAAESLIS